MPTPQELEQRFWKALKSDMTMMVGLVGVDDGHSRPLTAQMEGNEAGPIWFFTAKNSSLVHQITGAKPSRAVATFVSKKHDLFADVHGELRIDNDRRVIDALWNPFIAAWYEGGKDDPNITLLRFEPDKAEIWLDASSILAGIKILLGADPKQEYRDNVAKVRM